MVQPVGEKRRGDRRTQVSTQGKWLTAIAKHNGAIAWRGYRAVWPAQRDVVRCCDDPGSRGSRIEVNKAVVTIYGHVCSVPAGLGGVRPCQKEPRRSHYADNHQLKVS